MKIPLGKSGDKGYALVDPDRASEVLGYCWSLGTNGYVYRRTPCVAGEQVGIYLHRQLLGLVPGDGVEGDHINGDTLDNRLENLRLASHAANHQNKNFQNKGTSRFRGVHWHKYKGGGGIWEAQVHLDGETHYLGRFQSEVAAAQVVDAWRLEHMPFAQPDPELLSYHTAHHVEARGLS